MGKDHNYLDDALNRATMQRVATESYLPMNALLLQLIKAGKGKFKVVATLVSPVFCSLGIEIIILTSNLF